MEVTELKKYISDNNKIPEILESLGCNKINSKDKDWIYSTYPSEGSDNPKGICINKSNLSFISMSKNIKGDIISLIMEVKAYEFSDAMKHIHKILGLKISKYKKKQTDIFDPLDFFKKIKAKNYEIEIEDLYKYEDDVLNDFIPYLTKDWIIKNGIVEPVRKKFNLGFSTKHNRIIIPHLDWQTGDIVGIIGRTNNELYKELDIPKYYPIIKYNKSNNLYGLYENYADIQKAGYVVVYESEKSVIRRSARMDNTGVAICCKSMSRQQYKILCSLNVEIIIALDNDVSYLEILETCDMFYPLYNISFIRDKMSILGKKDSPADLNNEKFNLLLKDRIKYNDKWKVMLDKMRAR